MFAKGKEKPGTRISFAFVFNDLLAARIQEKKLGKKNFHFPHQFYLNHGDAFLFSAWSHPISRNSCDQRSSTEGCKLVRLQTCLDKEKGFKTQFYALLTPRQIPCPIFSRRISWSIQSASSWQSNRPRNVNCIQRKITRCSSNWDIRKKRQRAF